MSINLRRKIINAVIAADYNTLLDLFVIHASNKESYCFIYKAMAIVQDHYDHIVDRNSQSDAKKQHEIILV